MGESKIVNTIEHYGVYVKAKTGYVKLAPYDHPDHFVNFKYLAEVPAVLRADEDLTLIVFKKDFNEENLVLELRPIQTTVDIRRIHFNVKPLAKTDMYELSLDQAVADGTMLHAQSGLFWSTHMAVIVLGDTEKELERYFSNEDLSDAYAVKAYLDDSLAAFPSNPKLKSLSKIWDEKAESEKDLRDYAYVEEQWNKYQETAKLSLKAQYLESMLAEIKGYLQNHAKGLKATDAQERQDFAEKELKELEKQL